MLIRLWFTNNVFKCYYHKIDSSKSRNYQIITQKSKSTITIHTLLHFNNCLTLIKK